MISVTLTRCTLAALGLLAAVGAAAPAEAVVRYEAQSLTLTRPASNPYPSPEYTPFFSLEFVVSAAAVARGSFSVSGCCSPGDPNALRGDVADLESLSVFSRSGPLPIGYGLWNVRGVRPWGWTGSSLSFDRLRGVLILELDGTDVAEG